MAVWIKVLSRLLCVLSCSCFLRMGVPDHSQSRVIWIGGSSVRLCVLRLRLDPLVQRPSEGLQNPANPCVLLAGGWISSLPRASGVPEDISGTRERKAVKDQNINWGSEELVQPGVAVLKPMHRRSPVKSVASDGDSGALGRCVPTRVEPGPAETRPCVARRDHAPTG